MIDVSVVDINYAAVFVGAVVYMAVGMAWYSPIMFGDIWMKESGRSAADIEAAKKKGMGKIMTLAFIGALITNYVLAHFVDLMGATTINDALSLGFWTWLGFMMTIQLGSVLWDGKSWKFFAVSTLYSLVTILLSSVILTRWE